MLTGKQLHGSDFKFSESLNLFFKFSSFLFPTFIVTIMFLPSELLDSKGATVLIIKSAFFNMIYVILVITSHGVLYLSLKSR